MTEWLAQAGYTQGASDGVWRKPGYDGIPYSDGDEFEGRIEALLRATPDKSVFSEALASACVDWPSYYHLSCTRANILRPFEERLKGAEVLEVGAGCGAITRFLGESGANVCALEGSLRRARIARLRASDLGNVAVVTENLDSFSTEKKFDVVTFVGVLEYANQFVGGESPAQAMLQRARAMLKPGGVVIIAIENQLGLKYLAGAPEDHVGRRMFGIEDRYRPDGVRTYGREELTRLVRCSGFSGVNFYAPFPDYKFPITIFSEAGLKSADLDVCGILRSSFFSDRQLTNFLSFDPLRAAGVLMRNGLAMELANSFLVVASVEARESLPQLAWHYSTSRAPYFCKSIAFDRREGGDIRLTPRRLNSSRENPVSSQLTLELPHELEYVQGTQLSAELVSLLTTDGWSIEEVAGYFRRFLAIAQEIVRAEGVDVSLSSPEVALPGLFVDLIPQNVIRGDSNSYRLIDREWVYQGPVTVEWLVFRSLAAVFSSVPQFGTSSSAFDGTRLGFVVALFGTLGFGGSVEQVQRLGSLEASLQTLVAGQPVSDTFWGAAVPLSSSKDDGSGVLYSFDVLMTEVNNLCRILPNARMRWSAPLSELEAERNHYRARIERIERNIVWRLSKPLRRLANWWRDRR